MKDDERSHSRISFYAVFRDWGKPIYISTFLKLRRADDWIEGYQYYERIVGFIAKIDGIEYHINKNGDIRDALKLHEAFYEKEYLTGEMTQKSNWYSAASWRSKSRPVCPRRQSLSARFDVVRVSTVR